MDLQLIGSKKTKIEVNDLVFSTKFNESLVHQVVTAYMAGARAGTKAQKTRSEVSGGGSKPFRQKGTGQARAGTIRSPIWRKGGVTFAAKPRSHEQKVNKKMYKGAMRAIFSELIRLERLIIVDEFNLDSPKTKMLLTKLNNLSLDSNLLIVTDAVNENLYLAARNVSKLDVRDVAAIDPVALVGAERVLLTVAALKQVEELLK